MSEIKKTNFNCSEPGCMGNVDAEDPKKGVNIRIGCESFSMAFPCDECGRLYFGPNDSVIGRGENPDKVFLKEGKVVRIPQSPDKSTAVTAMHP